MSKYEVGVRAFTHVTVAADSEEEAAEKAREMVALPHDWQVDDVDPVALE